jgi:hypothetical protein
LLLSKSEYMRLTEDHGYVAFVVLTIPSFFVFSDLSSDIKSLNRGRTDNTVAKRKEKEKWSTKHYAKNSRLNNTNPIGGKLKWPGTVANMNHPRFVRGVRVTLSLVLCVFFVDRSLSLFFWPMCCLFFFDQQTSFYVCF